MIQKLLALVTLALSVLFLTSNSAHAQSGSTSGPWHVVNSEAGHTQLIVQGASTQRNVTVSVTKSNSADVVVRDQNGGEVSRTTVNVGSSTNITLAANNTITVEARGNGQGGWYESSGTYTINP